MTRPQRAGARPAGCGHDLIGESRSMPVERITEADLHARRAAILAEHPYLAQWRPTCERCGSMWCAVNTDGLTLRQRYAVVELDAIRTGLGEQWPGSSA